MAAAEKNPRTILCLASYFKGHDFMRECKALGWRVILLTREKLRHAEWPFESIDEMIVVPDDSGMEDYVLSIGDFALSRRIDRVAALEEGDVITSARVREHLALPGMNGTTARTFRDKLWMRIRAGSAGIVQPESCLMLNYQEVGEYMERVPPPWVVKPRADASSIGIRILGRSEEVWRIKDMLDARESRRERSSYYLLENYIAGDVYHVDSLVNGGRVVFFSVSKYGTPPLEVTQHGGVSTSHTLKYGASERRELASINRKLLAALGFESGTTHAEFIRSDSDGRFYFLEVAARAGGAYTVEAVEAAAGINLWREWARIEILGREGKYRLPRVRREFGGIAVSLARQEHPDTSAYRDPEIVFRAAKPWHVGLVLKSASYDRIVQLLGEYKARLERDFTAVAPQQERP